jgi:hypothetical protein
MVAQRIFLASLICSGIAAFTTPASDRTSRVTSATVLSLADQPKKEHEPTNSRRSFFLEASAVIAAASSLVTSTGAANAAQETEYRQGIEVTPFNGLIFNYRNSQFGGLDATDLNGEPSVSYAEFCQKLKDGQVEFVEFMAPDGDKAYVTFKPLQEGQAKVPPIRIGEGYPIEQHDGWSSPAFAVRSVKNAGVPYKFTVPGLAKYQAKSS